MKTAIFPGTFDPFTLGHASIVKRGLNLFDHIIIAIGANNAKQTMFTLDERIIQIRACYLDEPRVEISAYKGLTVDFAKSQGTNFILRGIRSLYDFEYERLLSDVNHKISNIETICLFAEPDYSSIQSNVIRELLNYKQDVGAFVPSAILEILKKQS
jgi:pantetheine-phosphate adenylyltransferase